MKSSIILLALARAEDLADSSCDADVTTMLQLGLRATQASAAAKERQPTSGNSYLTVVSWPAHAWNEWDGAARGPIGKCMSQDATTDGDGAGFLFASCCTSDGAGMPRNCGDAGPNTFAQAEAICTAQGGQLCTAEEAAVDLVTASKGCQVDGPHDASGADMNRLWTETRCEQCYGTHEAEDATIIGGAVEHANVNSPGHAGFAGRSFVDYINADDDYIEWYVSSCDDGPATASFRYALATGNRPLQVLVNGQEVDSGLLDFGQTGSWSTWEDVSVSVNLNAGSNVIRLVAAGHSGANMDSLTLAPVAGGIHEELAEALGEHGRQIEELHRQQFFTDQRISEVEEHFSHALETLHSMGVEALADQDGRIQANADDIAQLEADLNQSLAEVHQMGVEALQAQGGRIDGLAEHVLSLEEQFGNALEELHAMGVEAFADQGARVDELEGAMEGMHQSQAERITHMEEAFQVALADMHNLGDEALSHVQDQINNLGEMHDINNDRIDELEERVEALESAGQPPVDLPVGLHGVFNSWAATAGVHLLSGDFNGDGHTDVALLGGPGWGSIPVALSRGNGAYSVTNCAVPNMNAWEDSAGARPLVGDFDGDGKDDIALTGGHGWGSLPVAFSTENGCFTVTNHALESFPFWASELNVQVIAGDFDGDGKADVAAIGKVGWTTFPTAFSNGDGTFRVTNHAMSSGGNARHFNSWSSRSGVHVLAGDFNGDGKDDVALIGGPGWASVPVAVSAGDGTYNSVSNCHVHAMNSWIDSAGARPLVADFNGDGKDDIALTGGSGWTTIPVASSTSAGCFAVSNSGVTSFPGWAASANVQAVAGDFNSDGHGDIAAIGNSGWGSLPTAFGTGNADGTFSVTNHGI